MRYAALFLIAFVAMPVLADHHRGHALENLDMAQRMLDKVVNHTNATVLCASWEPSQIQKLIGLQNYIGKVQEKMDIARAALNDVGNLEALEVARSALSQPKRTMLTPNGNSDNSAAPGMMSVITIAGFLIPNVCDESAERVQQIITQSTFAWRDLDVATWHVIDAIREETYQDQAFICSGPNNHCQ